MLDRGIIAVTPGALYTPTGIFTKNVVYNVAGLLQVSAMITCVFKPSDKTWTTKLRAVVVRGRKVGAARALHVPARMLPPTHSA